MEGFVRARPQWVVKTRYRGGLDLGKVSDFAAFGGVQVTALSLPFGREATVISKGTFSDPAKREAWL
jgi:hypothetical protein